jgi:hypothetical protein
MFSALGDSTSGAVRSQLEVDILGNSRGTNNSTLSISSEAFNSFNEAMAHSQKQDFNRSHYTKADGATLKKEYEDFFA